MICKDSITSVYVVYQWDNKKLYASLSPCAVSLGDGEQGRQDSVCTTVLHYMAVRLWREWAADREGEAAESVCFHTQLWMYIHIYDASLLSLKT